MAPIAQLRVHTLLGTEIAVIFGTAALIAAINSKLNRDQVTNDRIAAALSGVGRQQPDGG